MLARSTSSFLNNTGARFESAIWTAKLMLLSVGVISTFLLFKMALIPCIFESVVPTCLGCVRALLAPPYIYIIVNFIIISIAVSSSSSDKSASEENYEEKSILVEPKDVKVSTQLKCVDTNARNDVISFFSTDADVGVGSDIEDEGEEVVVKHELTRSDPFPHTENSPPLAEDDEEEDDSYDDSLDGTWNAIMEGKGTVKKPFLRKSDTWNATRAPPAFPLAERVSNYQKHEMRKSETFNDRVSTLRAGGGLRRETLLTSQDSLNARVEAFINKFNNDMRMERQQSDMRYINMVKQQAAAT